jgi:ubiquinone/menaquinone biosynthesis C-methylase UbiE
MTKNVDVGRLYLAETPTELMAEYDRVADGYDTALVTDHEWRAPEIMGGIAAWLLPRSARLLDAACGTGLVAESLAHFGFADIQGLDFSPGMLAVAARKNVYTGLTEAALGDALPFRNGEFDAFLVCGAFTPKHAPPESFVELLRITRRGGFAIFTLRCDDPPIGFADEIERLVRLGCWKLVHAGAEFQSLPRAEPHVRNRIYVYEVL